MPRGAVVAARSQQSATSDKYGQLKWPSLDLHFAGCSLEAQHVPTAVVWCLNPFCSFPLHYVLYLLFPTYDMQWFAISELFQDSGKNSSSQLVSTSLVMPSAASPDSQEPFYFSFLIKKYYFSIWATFSQPEHLSHIKYIPPLLLFSSSSFIG